MDIKSITTFVAIADHRSFQNAAAALGMSISNVSLQINALEKDLGVSLFDRSSRPPRLTDNGKEFVDRCRPLLSTWESLASGISDTTNRGTLKVGAVHTAVAGGVSVALGRLRRRDSNMFIQLHTALTTQLVSQLQNHVIDCAVVTKPPDRVSELEFHLLAKEELGVIAHKDARGESYRQLLEQNPYVRFNRQATLARYIDQELKQRNLVVNSSMEVTTLDAVESLVKNGLGVSIVPVGKSVRSLPRGIRAVSFTEPPIYRTLGLMVRSDCPRFHLVEVLLKELRLVYDANR